MTENKIALSVKSLLNQKNYKNRFKEILGQKAQGFMSSLMNVSQEKMIASCEPNSVVMAAVIAATLDLPIDKNLGFAWIVPYSGKGQFQIGYKGLIQLAMRTGQYQRLNVTEIYAGQLLKFNPLTENVEFDFTKPAAGSVIGYAGYFRLNNGFEKTVYWSKEKVTAHAKRFSQAYKSGSGIWKTDENAMFMKTVVKNMLSKWGILSIDMQNAVRFDQSIVKGTPENNIEDIQHEYIDNPETDVIAEKTDLDLKRDNLMKEFFNPEYADLKELCIEAQKKKEFDEAFADKMLSEIENRKIEAERIKAIANEGVKETKGKLKL
jgi:recombination protein RecT